MTRTAAIAALLALTSAVTGAGSAQEPELVQPGVISTDRNETFPTIDPRDGSLWFSVYDGDDFDRQTIMVAKLANGRWSAPEPAKFSGVHGDRAPRFSPDGSKLYFTSNRPLAGHPTGDMNLWVTTRRGDGTWTEPEALPAPYNLPNGRDMHAAITARGEVLLASNRPGGAGRADIYRVDAAGKISALPPPINDGLGQPDLWISGDGARMILVVTGGPAGLGGDDLFLTRYQDGAWTAPRPLGAPINSSEYEYGPSMSPDGKWLYFTSHRRGNGDIYRIPATALRW